MRKIVLSAEQMACNWDVAENVNKTEKSMEAVLPYMKEDSPAALPVSILVASPNRAIPKPKNTLSTIPNAASSFKRVYFWMNTTDAVPRIEKTAAPAIKPRRFLSLPQKYDPCHYARKYVF